MTEQDEKQLWIEIEHIFDSGANELRVFNMVKSFIEKRYQAFHIATSWVAASEKLPSVEQNGNKVLIYRIMNNSQESLAISIYETSMVKYCNVDETWWMELPKPPCL